jgi:hypothetical protein
MKGKKKEAQGEKKGERCIALLGKEDRNKRSPQ